MDKKKTLLGVFVMLMGLGLSSFASIAVSYTHLTLPTN